MSEELKTEVVIDKSTWGAGPWQSEPDRVQWQHAGYACLALRNGNLGHWCAYVGVDRAHPYYGKSYDDCGGDIDVHGGLTYAGACEGAICHVPEPGMPDDVWWVGMDFAHWRDLSPAMRAREIELAERVPRMAELDLWKEELERLAPQLREEYRELAYVKAETERLAEQLRAKA